jgi:hypothetical protein
MKRTFKKKLILNKRTITNLTDAEMNVQRGGTVLTESPSPKCQSLPTLCVSCPGISCHTEQQHCDSQEPQYCDTDVAHYCM